MILGADLQLSHMNLPSEVRYRQYAPSSAPSYGQGAVYTGTLNLNYRVWTDILLSRLN